MLAGSEDINAYVRARKYLDAVQGRSMSSTRELREAHEALDTALAKLSAEESKKARRLADLAERKVAIEASIVEQQAIVDRFRTELQREAAEDATAVQQLVAAGLMPAATTQQAAGAIEWARARIGTPYCWGGTGPGCYDCSGLIQTAYESVGVFIPRTSYQMKAALPPTSEPVPGDIAWHPGHVGLYVGAGYTIEAPRTGDVVRYRAVGDRYSVYLKPVSVSAPIDGAPAAE
jgi:cell wall-associated NlpC family hydrolase